jgi:hypothetical protein
MATFMTRPAPLETPRDVSLIRDPPPTRYELSYRPLHDTFGAEVLNADFTKITPHLVAEIKAGLAKVSCTAIGWTRYLVSQRAVWRTRLPQDWSR